MDFLDIRKKAKDRGALGEGAPAATPPLLDTPPHPAPDPEPAIAARLQQLPAALDPRFATWRPTSGAAPAVLPPAPAPAGDGAPAPAGATARLEAPTPRPPVAPAPTHAEPLDEFFYREDEDAPGLSLLEAEPGALAAPRPSASLAREEYLTFLLGEEEYAVAIERVREVLKCPPVTEVPRAPAHILGVVTVRGEVVAVLDPRRRLGLPEAVPPPVAPRAVIVDVGHGPCGLLVDAVASVVRLPPGSVEPCPQGLGGAAADCLAGIGRDRDRLFTVLDLVALLRRAPAARRAGEGRGTADA
jgi:purine-binding chemotaxis protein CheW